MKHPCIGNLTKVMYLRIFQLVMETCYLQEVLRVENIVRLYYPNKRGHSGGLDRLLVMVNYGN